MAIVEKLMPLASAASKAFWEESSWVRTCQMPQMDKSVPTAAIAIGRKRAAICIR